MSADRTFLRASQLHRRLYDTLYLQSNCMLPYDDRYMHDDLFWTWSTNLLIVAASLFGLYSHLTRKSRHAITLFWIFTIAANIFASIGHGLLERTDDARFITIRVLTATCILLAQNGLLHATLQNNYKKAHSFIKAQIIGTICVFITVSVTDSLVLMGLYVLATYLYTLVSLLRLSTSQPILQAWAIIVILLSLLTQGILAGTCGKTNYEHCFKGCILPNAGVFNHNAIFHILWAIGLLMLGLGERSLPILSTNLTMNQA